MAKVQYYGTGRRKSSVARVRLLEFNKTYERLGVSFDSYAGESFYSDKMQEVVEILSEKNLLCESEGAASVILTP